VVVVDVVVVLVVVVLVLHKCDNPKCVNPDHLFLGTHTDNMRDMIDKGRDRHDVTPSGGAHGMARITNAQAVAIYAAKGEARAADLAKKYRVALPTIYAIWSGRNWSGVTGASGA
jgi:hypothetical protein